MTGSGLPDSSQAFAEATWDDLLPRYEALAARPLDAGTAEAWLAEWSTLEELVGEAANLAEVAYTLDTTDPAKEAAYLRFASEIGPKRAEQGVRLAKRLLDLGYSRPELDQFIRRFRNHDALFRAENVPLEEELERLNADYQRITGGMTAEWEGEEIPLPRLQPYGLEPDRAVRERAYRLAAGPYIAARDELAAIFDRQRALRQRIARNAGFADFRDYSHREKDRFDYTPQDCERWHEAVERTFVPAAARIYERRRRRMGLDTLRPWDLGPDPAGRPPLRPFAGAPALIARGRAVFRQVDPVLGGYFGRLDEEGLLDLDSRMGKAPGGYCATLEHRGQPFIFMNAAGVPNDVTTLLHEAGHAFHVFEADRQPLIWQRDYGSEIAEVASMAMELLAAPYLARERGGFYADDEVRRARIAHLEGIVTIMPHIASVDAFQAWIYTHDEGADRDARDAAWRRIRARFGRGIDLSGLEAEGAARWYQQLHIFLYPFYYIEYGIAQLGALQVWRDARRDQAGAVAAYRRALALGATAPLPDLFAAAGARLVFDAAGMGELVGLIEGEIAALEG